MFKRFQTCLAALLFVVAAPVHAAFIPADIVFVIDDSVSMGNDIAQVKQRIVQFNTTLFNAGIDANYALVRFGGPNQTFNTYGYDDHASVEQNLVDFATFNAAGGAFQSLTAPTSALEKGSVGVNAVFQGSANTAAVNFRANSVKNIILITDEDDDSSLAEFNLAKSLLAQNNALFNVIGAFALPSGTNGPCDAGGGNSENRYGVLAKDNGGTCFRIADFRANPGPFFDNFTQTKVQEIITAAPLPGTEVLLLVALAGLGIRRQA